MVFHFALSLAFAREAGTLKYYTNCGWWGVQYAVYGIQKSSIERGTLHIGWPWSWPWSFNLCDIINSANINKFYLLANIPSCNSSSIEQTWLHWECFIKICHPFKNSNIINQLLDFPSSNMNIYWIEKCHIWLILANQSAAFCTY